jgi:hypothetical protein
MKKAIWLLILGLALALGLFVGMQTPSAYADPTPGWHVQLPVLGWLGNSSPANRHVVIEVQNVSPDYLKARLDLFGAYSGYCEPQSTTRGKYECSGLLKPGSAWIWTDAQLPSWARSAIVYAISECGDGTGVIVGWPLAVEVVRRFPGATGDISSAYSGISEQMDGVYDPVYGGYAYYAPIVYAANGGLDSWLYIQNSGDQCTSVELWFKQQDDCLRAMICEILALAPGEMYAFPASACVGPGFLGSVWIRTSQPTGIIVDQRGADILMTYHAKPAELNYVFNGTPYFTEGSEVAYGPLIYREQYGWDSKVYVQNLSSITAAKVKVYFLDNSGDIITTLVDWVCPRGNQTFFLPMINQLPGNYTGQIRVESQEWWSPGDPKVLGPNIQAVAELIKYEGPARDTPLEAMAYTLFPEPQAFDWQLGSWDGAYLIGIPSLHQSGSVGLSSELAIANLNPNPGFTDFAIYIYDQNGLLDFVCEKLNEKQTEYINLDSWGYVQPGFKGSAVIATTFGTQWGGSGLAAVKVERSNTVLGVDIPGDESAASEGFPIYGDFGFQGPQIPTCPGQPEPCTAVVAATVRTHGGVIVPGALIQVVGPDGLVWTGTTDQGGHFTASLPASVDGISYEVQVNGVTAIFLDPTQAGLFCGDHRVWEIRLPPSTATPWRAAGLRRPTSPS